MVKQNYLPYKGIQQSVVPGRLYLYSFVAFTTISSINVCHSSLGEIRGCIPCSSVTTQNCRSILKHKCSSSKMLDNFTLHHNTKRSTNRVGWLQQYSKVSRIAAFPNRHASPTEHR
ncbi:hypothetical protein KSP40_PGU002443 [Platanthera guangdongensis]|uniref:Uncharacterized protein n=1 Tax=Platanthera guangdongensis TaxID=2320717 RepID=A0ABR2LJR3_9ASPA